MASGRKSRDDFLMTKPDQAFFLPLTSRLSLLPFTLLPALLLLAALGGCQPQPSITPPAATIAAPPAKKPAAAPVPVKAPTVEENLLVVLSDSSEIYSHLAEKLRLRSGLKTTILSLDTPQTGELSLANQLKSAQGPIIAVGIEAAKFLAPHARKHDVIFALVFNHRELDLLERGMIGVSMLPPPGQVLRLFKAISPQVTTLALPVKPDLADYAALARAEAGKLGLTLDTPEVGNDKELLLLTRKLDPATRGLWLLPDNRIISKENLQQIMAVSVKSGRQLVVFSPTLFPLGGLLSAEFETEATVATILEVALTPDDERRKNRGRLLQPRTGRLAINPGMVETLGLTVPPQHRPLLQDYR